MIYEHRNYRSYLRAVLAERITKNPSYSLRAFAKGLGLAPSTVSEVLKGTKNFSLEASLRVAQRLGLGVKETDYFSLLVQAESAAKSPEAHAQLCGKLDALNPRRRVSDLSVDVFRTIADWYHLPILELSRLDDFILSPQSASERLGIKMIEASAAIERLERLELLTRDAKGRLVKDEDFWLAKAEVPNPGLRQFHRQMLERAMDSLETQTPKEKFIGSETFGLDPVQLPEASAVIDRFLAEMAGLSARARRRTEVYHLGTQFFRLTIPLTNSKKKTQTRSIKQEKLK